MQKLVEGIHQFQQLVQTQKRQLFSELENGQQPLALFITCSDSRIVPNLITQTDPGEIFVLRTAGNIIPPYGAVQGGEAATIEYAVSVLKVRDIILCGHSHCGAMDALLNGNGLDDLPAVRAILGHAESTRRIIVGNYGHLPEGRPRLMATIEENVLVQLEHLRTHPSVAVALAQGKLRLHGWVYKFETGEVFAYDGAEQQYRSLDGTRVPLAQAHARPAI